MSHVSLMTFVSPILGQDSSSYRFHRCPHLRARCTLQLGSGNLADRWVLTPFQKLYDISHHSTLIKVSFKSLIWSGWLSRTAAPFLRKSYGKFWDLSTRGGDNILWPPMTTPLGAPPHELGSPSSMPGPMRMKLPTVVQYHYEKCKLRARAYLSSFYSHFLSRFRAVPGPKMV
jgi:hypothetical protein